MILLKLACDKCQREAEWSSSFPPADVRRYAQEKGWRHHKRKDLCPECALKVLGVIGAFVDKKAMTPQPTPAALALEKLRSDLAFAKTHGRNGFEAVVITDQATVREVLLEIERLNDQIKNPKAYAHRRTEHR